MNRVYLTLMGEEETESKKVTFFFFFCKENITKQKSTKLTFCSHTSNSGSDCVIGIDDLQLLNRREETIALSFVVFVCFQCIIKKNKKQLSHFYLLKKEIKKQKSTNQRFVHTLVTVEVILSLVLLASSSCIEVRKLSLSVLLFCCLR